MDTLIALTYLLSPLPFHPLPFPTEVNKKLSCRGQNALSVIKIHERNTDSEHIMYLSVCLSRLAGRIPNVRSSVRLSVCSFVRLLPTCERDNSVTNEPISMQIDINLPRRQGHERSTSESKLQKVKGQGHRRSKLCLEARRRHHSRSLESSR